MDKAKKKERGFKGVWIPADIWLNRELTVMEKLFLVEIKSLDNEQGCFASNAHFAEFFGLSKTRCSEVIRALVTKGLITANYEHEGKAIKRRTLRIAGDKRFFAKGNREDEEDSRKTEPDAISVDAISVDDMEKKHIKRQPVSNIDIANIDIAEDDIEGIRKTEEGIRKTEEGYSENTEVINTFISNIFSNKNINTINVRKAQKNAPYALSPLEYNYKTLSEIRTEITAKAEYSEAEVETVIQATKYFLRRYEYTFRESHPPYKKDLLVRCVDFMLTEAGASDTEVIDQYFDSRFNNYDVDYRLAHYCTGGIIYIRNCELACGEKGYYAN